MIAIDAKAALGLEGRFAHAEARLREASRAGYGESLRGTPGADPLA